MRENARGLGRVGCRSQSVLQQRNDRDGVAHHRRLHRAARDRQPFDHPREVFPALRRIRGHNMAKAGVEMAIWDLYARATNQPLSKVLGGTRDRIASGVSIGIQDSLDQLMDKIEKELAAGLSAHQDQDQAGLGHRRRRARAQDVRRHSPAGRRQRRVLARRRGACWRRLDPFDLLLIEQPLDYDDVMDHAVLQRQITTPVCLDESIHTVRIARDAIEAKACRIINIKPGRVGGHQASIELHDLCAANGIPGLARRHARERHRPRAQHSPGQPAEFHACPATSPPASATTSPT